MSEPPELISDEPLPTGWLRTELRGDVGAAQGHVRTGRRLLGLLRSVYGVNERLAAGEPGGFFRMARQLPDGSVIDAITNNGTDLLRITSPSVRPVGAVTAAPPEQEAAAGEATPQSAPELPVPETAWEPEDVQAVRQSEAEDGGSVIRYCEWEADLEAYSATFDVFNGALGPLAGTGPSPIYLVAQTSATVETDPDAFDGGAQATWSRLVFDQDTLAQIDSISLGDINYLQYEMAWDAHRNQFYVSFREAFDQYTLASWAPNGDVSRETLHMTERPADHGIVWVTQKAANGTLALLYDTPSAGEGETDLDLRLRDTDSGDEQALGDADSVGTTPAGDVLVRPAGSTQLVRYGANAGSYAIPAGMDDFVIVVCDNDEETLWLAVGAYDWSVPVKLYRYRNGQWQLQDVDLGSKVFSSVTPLLHDPVSNAVAFVLGDNSGAWIFNAVDCQEVPLAPFFFPFQHLPPTYLGSPGDPQQFYDARLLVNYVADVHDAPGVDSIFSVFFGVYGIGQLHQTEVTKAVDAD